MDIRFLEKRHQRDLKQRRTIKFIFIAGAVLLLAAVYGVFISGVFSIKKIVLSGSEKFSETQANEALAEFKKERLQFWQRKSDWLWFNGKEFSNEIVRQQESLAVVDVVKEFPNQILVTIKERQPQLLACVKNTLECFFVDEQGVVYAQAPQIGNGSLPRIVVSDISKIGSQILSVEFVRQFIKTQQILNQNLGLLVSEAELGFHLIVLVNEGWQIRFDPKSDFADRVADLKLLLDNEIREQRKIIEYVDLTVPGRAYYKLQLQ